jgi:FixJ family two-component response regulator
MKSTGIPTVFIVDDDRSMRQAIQDLVESVGLRAETFASSEEFLSRKSTTEAGCLVLDVRLPQMSGLDFQRHLTESGAQIRIIFITAHGDIPMSVRALKFGAVEFLTKPFRDQDPAGCNSASPATCWCGARTTGGNPRFARPLSGVDRARAGSYDPRRFRNA